MDHRLVVSDVRADAPAPATAPLGALRAAALTVADSPSSAAGIFVAAVILGVLANEFQAQILPPVPAWIGGFSAGATLFYLLLLLSALFVAVHAYGTRLSNERQSTSSALLREKVEELATEQRRTSEYQATLAEGVQVLQEDSIRRRAEEERAALDRHPTQKALASLTLTHGFQHRAFRDLLRVEAALLAKDSREARSEVHSALRRVLNTVLTLVSRLEDVAADQVIAANLMVPVRVSSLGARGGADALSWAQRLGYADLTPFEYVLWLDPGISFSTLADDEAPDPYLAPLILPVAREPYADPRSAATRLVVLPGAPQAFLQRVALTGTAKGVVDYCRDRERYDLPDRAAEVLEDYFRLDGRMIVSFVSLPVTLDPGRAPRAILNIHMNREGLLVDDRRREALIRVLQPTYHIISDLLPILQRVDQGLIN